MTYRNGVFVVDTRDGRIAQVTGGRGQRVNVREPGGGAEWEVPFGALRLATREERGTVGLWAEGAPARCAECEELKVALREAEAGGGRADVDTALVAQRMHWTNAHTLAGEAR
ncbi:hypothetical protein [Streptomyces olivoreticuli]|uniref:hypothetical protein n=1 Tax=Streptomyces olivoreticuli TaxID=68246 RepID=UPI000E24AD19|nr:hypothetical protein [Streptomyces olivoreticuli]